MTNVLLPSKMTYEISWSNSNITYHYFCCRFTDFRHEKRLCKNENWSIWGFSVTLITVYIPNCDHGFYLVSWVHTSGPLSQFHHHSSFIFQYLQVGKQGYCGPASHDTMSDSACKKQVVMSIFAVTSYDTADAGVPRNDTLWFHCPVTHLCQFGLA